MNLKLRLIIGSALMVLLLAFSISSMIISFVHGDGHAGAAYMTTALALGGWMLTDFGLTWTWADLKPKHEPTFELHATIRNGKLFNVDVLMDGEPVEILNIEYTEALS